MRHAKLLPAGILILSFAFADTAPNSNTLPITVTSNSATVDLEQGKAIYNGNVMATQGNRKLTGNSLTIQRANNGKIESFMAQGSPAKTQDLPNANSQMAYGEAKNIYYYPQQGLVKYVNNAKFTQGGNVFTGDLITYNTQTQVISSPQTKAGNGTTTIIIPPSSQQGDKNGS